MLFEPNSPEAAAASQFLVQSGLQQFLAGLIEVREVAVSNDDARLRIRVEYVELESGAALKWLLSVGQFTYSMMR